MSTSTTAPATRAVNREAGLPHASLRSVTTLPSPEGLPDDGHRLGLTGSTAPPRWVANRLPQHRATGTLLLAGPGRSPGREKPRGAA